MLTHHGGWRSRPVSSRIWCWSDRHRLADGANWAVQALGRKRMLRRSIGFMRRTGEQSRGSCRAFAGRATGSDPRF